MNFTRLITFVVCFMAVLHGTRSDGADTAEKFFESQIRPLLLEHCTTCHGGENPDAGLSLESREGWLSRDVIVPGEPNNSLLFKAVTSQDAKLHMPPADSGIENLTDKQIADLEQWIRQGAIDPRTSPSPSIGPKRRPRQFKITDQDLTHWAYQPIAESLSDASKSPSATIDQLIDEQLRPLGITRSPQATPRELVLRAYFDLWGLPPEPEVVAAFERDPNDEAWTSLIERLLDSPYYGQRWGRYWLDWVRYAETNGYERDGHKPNAWRYRDYVINSFNADKSYDRFLIEQLAGDQLIEKAGLTLDKNPQEWKDAVVATGYYRLHVWDDEPDNTEAAELDDLDDVMVTTGAAVMGMTLGCARCHDHKFDPLSQVDYYSMLDLFRDIDPYGLSKKGGGGRGTGQIERFLCTPKELDLWQAEKANQVKLLEAKLAEVAEAEKENVKQQLQQLKESQPPFDKALAINAPPNGRKQTFVLPRGDHQSPGQQVKGAIPELFRLNPLGTPQTADDVSIQLSNGSLAPTISPTIQSRLELAQWLTSPNHPLTARVLANRIWLNHFGSGIVPTPDDFGYTGIAPSNVRLLDHLARQLIQGGWSIKSLHRSIMLSQAYRMSSSTQHGDGAIVDTVDPDNRMFWRQNLRRLDAEAIRDSLLVYAGTLHAKSAGPSVYTTLSPEIRDTANPVSLANWGTSPAEEQNCRSVFLVVKRSLKDPLLESFDFANSNSPVGQRPITTVAPQALMMLNDRFVKAQSEKLANRLLSFSNDQQVRVEQLWKIVFQRIPTQQEQAAATDFVEQQLGSGRSMVETWTSLVRAVFNSNECIFLD